MNKMHSTEIFLMEVYKLSTFFHPHPIGLEQCAHVIDYCDVFIKTILEDKTLTNYDKELLIEFARSKKNNYNIAATISTVE
jgi:hypothetical protein